MINKSLLITNIRPDLMKHFKTYCAHHEISMRSCIIDYMEKVVVHSRSLKIDNIKIKSEPDDLFK